MDLGKLKERHNEEKAEWRTKHEEQIVNIEVREFLRKFLCSTWLPSFPSQIHYILL